MLFALNISFIAVSYTVISVTDRFLPLLFTEYDGFIDFSLQKSIIIRSLR